jgi:hypothetical protein
MHIASKMSGGLITVVQKICKSKTKKLPKVRNLLEEPQIQTVFKNN